MFECSRRCGSETVTFRVTTSREAGGVEYIVNILKVTMYITAFNFVVQFHPFNLSHE